MSAWHWFTRGCAPGDVGLACANCGYRIEHNLIGGTCPECGQLYIASTLQRCGPPPSGAWQLGWSIGPPILAGLAVGLMVASGGWPPTIAAAGLVMLALCLLQQQPLDWLVHHTWSDADRRRPGIWSLVTLWTLVSALNGVVGVVLLPLGLGIMLVDR